MSIENKLTRLTTARDNIRIAINEKGIDASEHGFENFAEDIGDIETGTTLQNLDEVAFGNNPTVAAEGSTLSANYEAIADAINAAQGRPNAIILDSLTANSNGTYTEPGKAYTEVVVDVTQSTGGKYTINGSGSTPQEIPTGVSQFFQAINPEESGVILSAVEVKLQGQSARAPCIKYSGNTVQFYGTTGSQIVEATFTKQNNTIYPTAFSLGGADYTQYISAITWTIVVLTSG